jgi:hypothetical protein
MDSLAIDGARAWLWTAWRQRDNNGWLVGNATAMRQCNGDGQLDYYGNERLGYGRLGNGQHNGLAMDSLTAVWQQWLAWRQCNVDVSVTVTAMEG